MIIVSSLKEFRIATEKYNAKHLISLIDPGFIPKTPKKIKHHLKLSFDDIIKIKTDNFIHRKSRSNVFSQDESLNNQILPNYDHIQQIVDFIAAWDQSSPLVVHCWCGVSRSMAAAVYAMCKINPINIDSNIKYLRSVAPHANPNQLMISMFEKALGIPGEINRAFKKYPYTVTYDCETNFAPISIFSIKELLQYK